MRKVMLLSLCFLSAFAGGAQMWCPIKNLVHLKKLLPRKNLVDHLTEIKNLFEKNAGPDGLMDKLNPKEAANITHSNVKDAKKIINNLIRNYEIYSSLIPLKELSELAAENEIVIPVTVPSQNEIVSDKFIKDLYNFSNLFIKIENLKEDFDSTAWPSVRRWRELKDLGHINNQAKEILEDINKQISLHQKEDLNQNLEVDESTTVPGWVKGFFSLKDLERNREFLSSEWVIKEIERMKEVLYETKKNKFWENELQSNTTIRFGMIPVCFSFIDLQNLLKNNVGDQNLNNQETLERDYLPTSILRSFDYKNKGNDDYKTKNPAIMCSSQNVFDEKGPAIKVQWVNSSHKGRDCLLPVCLPSKLTEMVQDVMNAVHGTKFFYDDLRSMISDHGAYLKKNCPDNAEKEILEKRRGKLFSDLEGLYDNWDKAYKKYGVKNPFEQN